MPSSHLILGHPLLLPPIPPSIRVFSNESTLHMRWPRYWSFSFSIIPSKEIPGLTSFRMDWLDFLAVQGTLKSLLQHHSSQLRVVNRTEDSVQSLLCAQPLGRVWLFVTSWTLARQAPLSLGFSWQEYWSGLPFPFPGDLPNPGIEPGAPACRKVLYHWATWEVINKRKNC